MGTLRGVLVGLTMLGLGVAPGCGANGGNGPSPAPDAGGSVDAAAADVAGPLDALAADVGSSVDAPAADVGGSCLTGARCVDNSDCASGSRCNRALDPPACVLLYCGAPGTACSDDVFCAPSSRCVGEAGRCTACTMCSDECVLDLSTNPRHCGACGRECVGSQQCRAGACVLDCDSRSSACGSLCVDLTYSDLNCGACGLSCGVSDGDRTAVSCSNGRCSRVEARRDTVPSTTCDSYCTPLGLRCNPARSYGDYGSGSMRTQEPVPCGSVPPRTNSRGQEFGAALCECLPVGT